MTVGLRGEAHARVAGLGRRPMGWAGRRRAAAAAPAAAAAAARMAAAACGYPLASCWRCSDGGSTHTRRTRSAGAAPRTSLRVGIIAWDAGTEMLVG